MKRYQVEFSIEKMSKMLGVTRSGYYRFIQAPVSKRQQDNAQLTIKVREIFEVSKHRYGSPRLHAELRAQGSYCSRKRVARLMKQAGLIAKMSRAFKRSIRGNPQALVAPNLLKQCFITQAPNQVWVADITYIRTGEGWLYVATLLDLFSRRIVGLAMRDRMTAD